MKKLQLELDADAVVIVQTLQEATGAASMSEVMRNALGVYSSLQALLVAQPQCRLALIDREAGSMQELFVPALLRRQPVVVASSVVARELAGEP